MNRTAAYAPETLRDLAKISEINQKRLSTAISALHAFSAVNDVGNYLGATKCLATIGPSGQPPQMAAEFLRAWRGRLRPGSKSFSCWRNWEMLCRTHWEACRFIASQRPHRHRTGPRNGTWSATERSGDAEAGRDADRVGFATPHNWKQNETYFLQAIGEQMLLCLHHTRLRSLVRTLAAADEKTGLLARGAYLDCLLRESQRVRRQGGPLSLALLQVDGAPDLLHQHGEGQFETYMDSTSGAPCKGSCAKATWR